MELVIREKRNVKNRFLKREIAQSGEKEGDSALFIY
jgi:hypothetical protein